MAKPRLSLPHERAKARLKSSIITHRVKIAEHREKLTAARAELAAMTPTKRKE